MFDRSKPMCAGSRSFQRLEERPSHSPEAAPVVLLPMEIGAAPQTMAQHHEVRLVRFRGPPGQRIDRMGRTQS